MTHAIALIHEENGVFGISFPDFRGCVSTADSLDDAIARGRMALELHIAGMVEDGTAMPILRTPDQIRQDPRFAEDLATATFAAIPIDLPGRAVRLNITMDEHLVAALDRAAKASGSSRSGFLAEAVRARLTG